MPDVQTDSTPPAIDPSSFLSAAAPPQIPQAAPQMPTYDPSQEQQTDMGESWAGGGRPTSFLSQILHAVGDVLGGPKTAQTVDANGNIVNTPLTTGQRARNAIGTAIVGGAAGLSQRGPGAVGRAALAGVQATQEQQQQNHKDLMDSASVAMRNNQWLLQQREFDLRSQEFQRQLIDSDNAIEEHMADVGATKVPIMGADGQDHNGTAHENELMQWRMNNKPAPGTSYVPTASLDAKGNRVYTIYSVPHDSLKDVRAYSPEESAAMGLPPQTSYVSLKDALSLQELHAKNVGLPDTAKRFQDSLSGQFKLANNQDDATSQINELASTYRFFQAHPMYATPDAIATIADRTKQIHDAFPSLHPTAQAQAVSEAGQKAGAEEQAKQSVKASFASIKPGNMMFGSMPDGSQVAGTPDELQRAGASGIMKLDADSAKKTVVARQLIAPNGLFNMVNADLRKLDSDGKLGVVASRWNDFMTGKVGSDPEYAPLRTHMGLLSTALMQAHVGARGSNEMLEHFKSLADYRISDGPTLRSALGAEYGYVKEKAMLPKTPLPAPQAAAQP
jgi:hypothetical protein